MKEALIVTSPVMLLLAWNLSPLGCNGGGPVVSVGRTSVSITGSACVGELDSNFGALLSECVDGELFAAACVLSFDGK